MDKQYIPLHLKYRPHTFKHIIGQFNATNYLEQAIRKKKVTFAYLFSGQQGTGKTTLARVMAKALNCNSLEIIPCNNCDSCINIDLGRSLDFYEIEAAKNTGIENTCGILETIQSAPILSKYKVCLIDEIDMLSNKAFNKLLQILKCPLTNTVFILLTTSIHKIPDTLSSRCQTIYFQPIKKQDLSIAISKIIHNEKLRVTNKAIKNLLNISNGNFRNALNKIELFSIEKYNITEQSLNDKYLLPPLFILDILIERILHLNLLKALIIVDYIQINNWNKEYIISSMYNMLINKYIEKTATSYKSKHIFFNIKCLINLLEVLIDSKMNNNSNLGSDLIYFLLQNDHKKRSQITFIKRKKILFFIPKHKIYSN